jgi:RAP1 GTPase activating protein 1
MGDTLQVPVAELLARPVPTLHSPSLQNKKSSNFLQVPEIEAPRPKSVPNSPSIPRYRMSGHKTMPMKK